jgi:hypothetical protein
MDDTERERRYAGWKKAVQRSLDWASSPLSLAGRG